MAQVWLMQEITRWPTARDIESLTALSEKYGDQVKLFALDLTDESAAASAAKAAIDAFGCLDVVITAQLVKNMDSLRAWLFYTNVPVNTFVQ